jgi:hypothetical protein
MIGRRNPRVEKLREIDVIFKNKQSQGENIPSDRFWTIISRIRTMILIGISITLSLDFSQKYHKGNKKWHIEKGILKSQISPWDVIGIHKSHCIWDNFRQFSRKLSLSNSMVNTID